MHARTLAANVVISLKLLHEETVEVSRVALSLLDLECRESLTSLYLDPIAHHPSTVELLRPPESQPTTCSSRLPLPFLSFTPAHHSGVPVELTTRKPLTTPLPPIPPSLTACLGAHFLAPACLVVAYLLTVERCRLLLSSHQFQAELVCSARAFLNDSYAAVANPQS